MDYQMHHRIIVWMEMASLILRESFHQALVIEEKANARDLVTQMDKATEAFFVEKISEYYPNHRIIGEEGTGRDCLDTDGTIWVIDPIDGTMNFIKQHNYFGIMIGIFQDGQPVAGYIYNVMAEDLYYGIVGEGVYLNHKPLTPLPLKSLSESLVCGNINNFIEDTYHMQRIQAASLGARSYGAAALELIGLIRGEVGAYFSVGLNPWDFAAGYAICQAMGFKATNLEGELPSILKKTPILFARPEIHQEVLALLN